MTSCQVSHDRLYSRTLLKTLAYAFACLIVPTLWAVAVFHVVGWIERRRGAVPPGASTSPTRDDDLPPMDYVI